MYANTTHDTRTKEGRGAGANSGSWGLSMPTGKSLLGTCSDQSLSSLDRLRIRKEGSGDHGTGPLADHPHTTRWAD